MDETKKPDDVWAALEGLRDSAAVKDAFAYADGLARARRRGWRLAWAPVCAAIAVLVLVAWPRPEDLKTGVGELRTVTLADGSTVTLNTATQLSVAFTEKERRVTLLGGEARFDVAHDAARPFRVTAGPMTVTAVGTAFDVTALPQRMSVTLIEGKVVVEAKAADASMSTTLSAGEQITVTPDGHAKAKTPAKIATTMAWQQSLIDLNDLPLKDALAEVNRYSETKVVVRDPALQDRRVSGVFRTGDVEAVARALGVYFDLAIVSRSKDAIVLER